MTEREYKIYAVDFDGTLVEDNFPQIGADIPAVQNFIKARHAAGDKIILWTCRTGEYLDAAVGHCLRQGIYFDAVNENLKEIRDIYGGGDTRKVFADFYIDDKSAVIVNDQGQFLTTIGLLAEENEPEPAHWEKYSPDESELAFWEKYFAVEAGWGSSWYYRCSKCKKDAIQNSRTPVCPYCGRKMHEVLKNE